ncbi:MAG: tetratricopeptide repeat protein [Coleofasciculus sp. G3-WIS-01]|uniref:tetratricopeptide repeat protein n=1 Tax=Coleofasciculus sp. G3-WIS-01 TaxID=3069528 RepID=UPI0032F9FA86
MIKRFWQWLVRLIQPILPPFLKPKRHRRLQKRLSDAEYQQLFRQLLTGVNQGWNREQILQHLGYQSSDRYFKVWLFEYGQQLRQLPEADHQFAGQLLQMSGVGCGELGEIAAEIGQDLLAKPSGKGEEEQEDKGDEDKWENAEGDAAAALLNQGKQQLKAQDFLGAIASFEKAIQIKPDYPEAWNNRGLALGNLGDYESAIASYEKAIQIKPNYQLAWYNWGVALDKLGEKESTISPIESSKDAKGIRDPTNQHP